MKKILSMALAVIIAAGSVTAYAVGIEPEGIAPMADGVGGSTAADTNKSVTDYSYTITPLLEPFSSYFFVKTDNPDPESFRFYDKSSKYENDNSDECISTIDTRFADINYEDSETGRVNGGYIFRGSYTDGGEVVLQSKTTGRYYWDYTWDDTDLKYELPALKDHADYLIDTYANKSEFFDNMDAVEAGFSDICLYSGSYVRGEIYKAGEYWSLSNSPHVDQAFYLQSPYGRKDNQSLFASAIYPFRYDSLGFPGMMGLVSRRLDSASSYQWSSYSHAYIDVTYNGETRSYGGQGNGEGQGIEKSDIKQFFTFGTNGTKITLDSAKELLIDYGNIQVPDDVPREDALTWESVYDTVGSGSWVKLSWSNGYAYLYRDGDGSNFYSSRSSDTGGEIYWGGDIGYASNAWVDGRYVSQYEMVFVGDKFEDHPTSSIILKDVTVPQVKYFYEYEYNYDSGEYEGKFTVTSITETQKTVKFRYDSTENVWRAGNDVFDDDYANIHTLYSLVNTGALEKKYLDMVTLTPEEVKELNIDRNTDIVPEEYYIYDGTCEPGTKNTDVITIAYNANGGSGTMANTKMIVGTAANLRANAFTRTGYTFLGWSTSASATTATYTDEQSVKDLANGGGTVTLYAVWSPQHIYSTIDFYIPRTAEDTTSEISVSLTIFDGDKLVDNLFFENCENNHFDIDISGMSDGEYSFIFSVTNCAARTYDATVSNGTLSLKSVELHLRGDINGDGKITNSDVLKANASARKTTLLEGYELSVADIDNDGKITNSDVLKMNAHARKTRRLW